MFSTCFIIVHNKLYFESLTGSQFITANSTENDA